MNATDNSNHFVSSGAIVTIVSDDPTVSIPENSKADPTANTAFDVTLTKKNYVAALENNMFSVVDKDVNAVANAVVAVARKSDTVATVTVDGTRLSTAKAPYKIKVSETAYGQVASTGLLTGTFTLKTQLGGTVTIDNTSPVYGDTLTAVTTSVTGANALSYKWYKGDTAIANATSSAYTVAAGDIGSIIKVQVTDSVSVGSVTSAATAAVAKKTITRPANASDYAIPAIAKDTTLVAAAAVGGTQTKAVTIGLVGDDAVNITYEAHYAAGTYTQDSDATDMVTLKNFALSGDDAANYQLNATTDIGPTNGSVSSLGYYALNTSVSTTYGSSNTAVALTLTGNTTVQHGNTETITVTGLPNGYGLDTVTVGNGEGSISNITNNTFKYTAGSAADHDPANATTVTITLKRVPITGAVVWGTTKTYDGTNTIDATAISTDSGASTVNVTGITVTTTSADADTYASATVTAPTGKALTSYEADDGLLYEISDTCSAEITKATATNIKAEVASGTLSKSSTIDDVINAIKGAEVKVDSIPVAQGTVGDYFSTAADIEALLQGLTTSGGALEGAYTTPVTPTTGTNASATTVSNAVKGDTYVFAAAIAVTDSTSTTVDADDYADYFEFDTATNTLTIKGNIPGGTTVSDGTSTMTFGAAGTDVEAKDVVAGGWDFSGMAGKEFSINLTFSASAGAATALGKNFDDVNGSAITVTAAFKRNAVSAGSYATFNTNGLATASTTDVEIVDGKFTELPTISNVAKGIQFIGWSTDGTVEHIIDIDTYDKAEDGDELVAVFEGYMTGNGDKMRPKDNVTRAEFVKMLVVASGLYDGVTEYTYTVFTDLTGNFAWSIPYVACAEQYDIIDGRTPTTFDPGAPITREEAAKIVANTFNVTVTEGDSTDKVSDFATVSDWAQKFVAALCKNGTIGGYPDGTFQPKSNITRAEAAKMINLYIGLTDAKREAILADTTITHPYTDIAGNWAIADLLFASMHVATSNYVFEITMPAAE